MLQGRPKNISGITIANPELQLPLSVRKKRGKSKGEIANAECKIVRTRGVICDS